MFIVSFYHNYLLPATALCAPTWNREIDSDIVHSNCIRYRYNLIMAASSQIVPISGLDKLSLPNQIAVLGIVLVILSIAVTHLFTNLRYHYQIDKALNTAERGDPNKKQTITPPALPYTFPLIGHAFWFINPFHLETGKFWRELMNMIPRRTGAITIQLGPAEKTHILFDPLAIDTMMKMRHLNRDQFNKQVSRTVNNSSEDDVRKYYGVDDEMTVDDKGQIVEVKHLQELHMHEFLLNGSAVRELTAEFARELAQSMSISETVKAIHRFGSREISIASWLREVMFRGSLNALYGTKILEVYPEFEEDYWTFDNFILHFFFMPKALLPSQNKTKDRCIAGLQRWHEKMQEESGGLVEDVRGPVSWEPRYGSRFGRARQIFMQNRKLSSHGCAGSTLGIIFALESNAIPTAQWMLTHILDPRGDQTMRERIQAEVDEARQADGSLDTSKLIASALLQSAFTETMRLYTDVLVARNLESDLVLPMTNGKSELHFGKGSTIFAPSWLGHRDSSNWDDVDTWRADRFLVPDPSSDDPNAVKFSMTGTNGKYFPFGGGKTMCPGRSFAKAGKCSII